MTRRRIHFAAAARADVDGILHWIALRSGSADIALRWSTELDTAIDRIAFAPGVGTARPEVGRGVRTSPFGNYLIYFSANSRTLRVLRVIYGGRDLNRSIRLS